MTASIAQQKIRIRLKAFDRRMLDLSCDKIIQTADTTSASAIGPILLIGSSITLCLYLFNKNKDKELPLGFGLGLAGIVYCLMFIYI